MVEPTPVPASSVPVLVYLHALGSSHRAADELAARFGDSFETLAVDLPGFGSAAHLGAATVDEMAGFVIDRIADRAPTRWLLVGHSMGGKIATIVASRVLDGTAPLFGLAGVVLLAASPPAPEPMDEERRDEMLDWVTGAAISHDDARTFVDANVGAALPARSDALALGDVTVSSPEAWSAWLERGSLEDWSSNVGTLDMPALIVSGGADGDLGAEAQRELNGPVYPSARFETLAGAGHLLPWERPAEVAALVTTFADSVALAGPEVPAATAALIASSRTSSRTRGILARRALADDPAYQPAVLTPGALHTLRAIADRVVPQQHPAIDLAARLDAQLDRGDGDGWRNAELPADPEAYARALEGLDGFADLDADEQDARLRELAEARFAPVGARLSASHLASWFEDARADLVRLWLAHPASLARVGFDGFATGGDGPRKTGFRILSAGTREPWEPGAGPSRVGLAAPTARHAPTARNAPTAPHPTPTRSITP
ncbi:alpha/beta fold hydrolase [Herbiconiux sp. A18JL235]|uniref:Alpha/beta fold hydrolase n=1 Tax=Herbiconiux sp. A18JL235 TaxID=3152363 RepID=A0AB39BKN8_9MICO